MCSDEGLPARVLALDEANNSATVQLENEEREVALDLLDGVEIGDFVLVHLDTAIAKLNAANLHNENH
jgi:hydrogenase expression/formation protein HypC